MTLNYKPDLKKIERTLDENDDLHVGHYKPGGWPKMKSTGKLDLDDCM